MVKAKAIIVTGTPGTGKTRFAKALAKDIEAYLLPLSEYVTKNRLYVGIDPYRASKIIDVIRTRASIRGMLASSQVSIVVDTHVPEGIVDKGSVRQVFVLRCHPRILETRLRAKGWNRRKIRENLLAEILDHCLISSISYYGSRRVTQLDTSKTSLKSNLNRAKRILVNRTPKRKIMPDWIRQLGEEGLLQEYLR